MTSGDDIVAHVKISLQDCPGRTLCTLCSRSAGCNMDKRLSLRLLFLEKLRATWTTNSKGFRSSDSNESPASPSCQRVLSAVYLCGRCQLDFNSLPEHDEGLFGRETFNRSQNIHFKMCHQGQIQVWSELNQSLMLKQPPGIGQAEQAQNHQLCQGVDNLQNAEP